MPKEVLLLGFREQAFHGLKPVLNGITLTECSFSVSDKMTSIQLTVVAGALFLFAAMSQIKTTGVFQLITIC